MFEILHLTQLASAPFEKGGWRRLRRRLGDLLLTLPGESKQQQEQEQIPPTPLLQRGEMQFPAPAGDRL
jgi:hypothetical protein